MAGGETEVHTHTQIYTQVWEVTSHKYAGDLLYCKTRWPLHRFL